MPRLGVESLLDEGDDRLAGQRLGLITNPSGVKTDLTPTVDVLSRGDDLDLRTLFGPEHGIRGSSQTGTTIDETLDDRTGLPVKSLRTSTDGRPGSHFADLDTVIYDVQDIGCRFYTHVSTILRALEGVASADKRMVVLDRPNPIAPMGVIGNVASPVGYSDGSATQLPIAHGLTVGELARYFKGENEFDATLEVVRVDGWERSTWFDETGLPWVQPSPNMPTPTTASVYPGTCFFEATNLSEGRGTTKPFELVGAPWIDADEWADELNRLDLAGVGFRPAYFTPMFSKHERKDIEGVQVHVLDRDELDPVAVGLAMLISAFTSYDECEWLGFNDGYFIDELAGGSYLRKTIDGAKPDVDPTDVVDTIDGYWADDRDRFRDRCERYTLY